MPRLGDFLKQIVILERTVEHAMILVVTIGRAIAPALLGDLFTMMLRYDRMDVGVDKVQSKVGQNYQHKAGDCDEQ